MTSRRLNLTVVQAQFMDALNKYREQFLVIGGKAIQAYGLPRATSDLDIWVSTGRNNPTHIMGAMASCDTPATAEILQRLCCANNRLSIPDPYRPEIDILTSIGNLAFEEVYGRASSQFWRNHHYKVPSIPDLIETKKAAVQRTEQDLANGLRERNVGEAQEWLARDRADIELLSSLLE